jgi:ElaB/YqjD/DUF883 family membrane-anchored ribosome-binding protein
LRWEKKLNREITEKIETETTKLYNNIKQVKDDADKEFSGVKIQFDNLVSRVNDKLVEVSDNTKEITREVIKDVDRRLDKVVCQIVSNEESSDERIPKLKDNIKEVKSNFKRDVYSRQNEAREQVSREIKQIESNKDRLEKINVELRNIKSKLSEGQQ